MFRKTKNNKGGLKELLYDNMGVFIVGVLIVVTIFAVGNKLATRGVSNKNNIEKIEDGVNGTGISNTFVTPTDLD